MNTTKTTSLYEADAILADEIIDAAAEAGFIPLDCDFLDDELDLTARDRSVIDYFTARGWDMIRLGGNGPWGTLTRWSDDGIRVMAIDRNGVELGEARLDFNAMGVAWFRAMVTE